MTPLDADGNPRELTRLEREVDDFEKNGLKAIVKPEPVYGYCVFCAATLRDERPYCSGHTADDI